MLTNKTAEVAETLIELLSQQRSLYLQLQELAEKQGELVDGSDPENLLKLLAARQRLVDKLTVISRELQPLRDEWAKILPSLTREQRREAQRLIESVKEILGNILAYDEKDFKALSNRKVRVAGEIRHATAGKQLNNAYTQSGGASGSRYTHRV